MAGKPLRSQLNQIRAWVREGRTDAWIAHQLEISASELREFRRRHDLTPDSEPDTSDDLRDEIEACRRESSVVRHAAEMLAQHVSGILQTVHAAFGATKTYGRAGRLAVATPIRTVDLKS